MFKNENTFSQQDKWQISISTTYKDNWKIEINNKGECEMTTLISNRDLAKIREEDVYVLKVMAHPVRLKIVNELMHHKLCNVTQLTEILGIPQSTVSQHLSKLRGTVLRVQRRGLEMHYYIDNVKARQIVGILGL